MAEHACSCTRSWARLLGGVHELPTQKPPAGGVRCLNVMGAPHSAHPATAVPATELPGLVGVCENSRDNDAALLLVRGCCATGAATWSAAERAGLCGARMPRRECLGRDLHRVRSSHSTQGAKFGESHFSSFSSRLDPWGSFQSSKACMLGAVPTGGSQLGPCPQLAEALCWPAL